MQYKESTITNWNSLFSQSLSIKPRVMFLLFFRSNKKNWRQNKFVFWTSKADSKKINSKNNSRPKAKKNNLFKVGQEKFRPSFLLTSKVKSFVPLGNVKRRKIGFDIDREVGNFYKFQKLKIHNWKLDGFAITYLYLNCRYPV